MLLDYGEPVATLGLRSDSKLPYRLEFSLDGERFTTSAAYYYREPVVAEAHAPPPRRTLGSVLVGLRAALLYHYLPYDKSAFGRLQSPPSLLLQLLAVGPMWLRGPFFTLFLLLTLMDTPDEYTLMRFILGLKSSQERDRSEIGARRTHAARMVGRGRDKKSRNGDGERASGQEVPALTPELKSSQVPVYPPL